MGTIIRKKNIPHSLPSIGEAEANSIAQTMASGYVGVGEKTEKVCNKISQILTKNNTFFVNSGTSALFLALKALGIKKGDEIILPNYSCPSLYNQVINCEAIPVIIDTYKDSFFVDIQQMMQKINIKTRAIIFNHPFGHYDEGILELIKATKIPIIEDITHSVMAESGKGLIAGQIGDITISSLGSTKFITSGTGGFLSLSDSILAHRISVLLDYDYNKYPPTEGGERYNMMLGDLNASLLLAQLEQLPTFIKKRKEIASKYYKNINNTFPDNFNKGAVYFRFFVKAENQKVIKMRDMLLTKNIYCAIGGVKLVSDISPSESFENSKILHQSLLSIPIYPSMTEKDVAEVVNSINEIELSF